MHKGAGGKLFEQLGVWESGQTEVCLNAGVAIKAKETGADGTAPVFLM